jgi:hypothetical protein
MNTLAEIKSYTSDSFLMSRCDTFTKTLVDAGMGLNEVCKVISEYQRTYLLVKKQELPQEILETFTPEVWWKSRR